MRPRSAIDEDDLERLIELAVRWTGFSRQAIRETAVREMVAVRSSEGESMAELLRAAAAGEMAVVHALQEAVVVGETYFFRQPEQFALLEEHVRARRVETVRAWSAGCATGEEAYSIAACLLSCLGDRGAVEVLGTDLLAPHISIASAGVYGRWSERRRTPLRHPVFAHRDGERAVIDDRLHRVTRFKQHNLLDPPPGQFDVVFCRNVLLYFSEEGAARAYGRLVEALAPGGILVLGTLDVLSPPPGVIPLGAPELTTFVRPMPHVPVTAAPLPRRFEPPQSASTSSPEPRTPPSATRRPARRSTIPPPDSPDADAVREHVRALALVEHGDRRGAARALDQISLDHPEYLPAVFECALLHGASGARERATKLMHEVLRRASQLPAHTHVSGPRVLPAAFYVAGARAFLERMGERS